MFSDLPTILERVRAVTSALETGIVTCLDSDALTRLSSLIAYNRGAAELLARRDQGSADWTNQAVRFLHNEFFSPDMFAPGSLKLRKLNVFCDTTRDEILREEVRRLINPFDRLYRESAGWLTDARFLCGACVIVTALPLEFRAVVRRLTGGILRLEAISNDSSAAKRREVPSPGHAFEWAFNSSVDEHQVLEAGVKKTERPFWLIVEGAVVSDRRGAKVTVILLPGYGGHLAQAGIEHLGKGSVPYREVLVVGVAGRLAESKEAGIGDVVVSKSIFDGDLRKCVPMSKGRVQFPKKDVPWDFGEPQYAPRSWTPTLHETPPVRTRSRQVGSPRVVPTDIVSGSGLSKALEYRHLLEKNFPTCKAIEMEALGCCHATSRLGRPVRVIKGLCDNADFRKSKRWQPYCADVAAAFAADYVLALYGEEVPRSAATPGVATESLRTRAMRRRREG